MEILTCISLGSVVKFLSQNLFTLPSLSIPEVVMLLRHTKLHVFEAIFLTVRYLKKLLE